MPSWQVPVGLQLILFLLLLQRSSPSQQVARAGNFISELLPNFELSMTSLIACAAAADMHQLSRRLQLRDRLRYQPACHLLWLIMPNIISIFVQLLASSSLLTIAKGTGRPLPQAYFQQRMGAFLLDWLPLEQLILISCNRFVALITEISR